MELMPNTAMPPFEAALNAQMPLPDVHPEANGDWVDYIGIGQPLVEGALESEAWDDYLGGMSPEQQQEIQWANDVKRVSEYGDLDEMYSKMPEESIQEANTIAEAAWFAFEQQQAQHRLWEAQENTDESDDETESPILWRPWYRASAKAKKPLAA